MNLLITHIMTTCDEHISVICFDLDNKPFRIVCGVKVEQIHEHAKRDIELNLSCNRERVLLILNNKI